MTHAVLRGEPNKAQLYLENVIRELVQETGRPEDRYCINKILFKCLRDHPQELRHIDAATDERETNESVLERSVRAARALERTGITAGDTILLMCRNSLESVALYFGAIFAGVNMYLLYNDLTEYELEHFISLKEPKIIFADAEEADLIDSTLQQNGSHAKVIVFGKEHQNSKHQSFGDYVKNCDGNVNTYWPADLERDDVVLTMTTSGSTGLPKAAKINNKGLVAQLPSLWCHSERIPHPTELYFCPSSYSWITMSTATQVCAVYRSPVLYTSAPLTAHHTRHILRTYKPTFTSVGGHFIKVLQSEPGSEPGDFHCFDTLLLIGSAVPEDLIVKLRSLCHPAALVNSSYGITEAQGFVTVPSAQTPICSIGKVINTLHFKIVDDEGNELGPNEPGELLLKSEDLIFKGYVNNPEAYKSCFDDAGWYRTGDRVRMDENEEIFFIERIKFLIKYQNHHISPSELEAVICGVEGVYSAAVIETSDGPAALVVPLEGHEVKAHAIHDAIKEVLSDRKKLRGGIAFVRSLPLLRNQKLERTRAKQLFQQIHHTDIHYDINSN